jgi:hypothetical protein
MVISETEPTDKVEGMQWLNPTTGLVLFWDDEKWLQMPTTGAAGKDGVDGLWTDNGDTTISYMDGNVGIGTEPSYALHVNSGANNAAARIETTTAYSLLSFDNASTTASAPSVGSNNDDFRIATNGYERFRIDADGNVGVGGEAAGWSPGQTTLEIIGQNSGNPTASGAISFKTQDATTGYATIYSPSGALEFWTGSFADNQRRLTIDNSGRVDITGSLYVNGTPKIGTVDLIKAFSKLRDAVKDEDTVEALKESITNCIGGLIEEWESMQASTQEIADE